MARIVSSEACSFLPLDEAWELSSTLPQACATPANAGLLTDWLPASVPGTVAASLRQAGRWSLAAAQPLNDRDHWYRTRLGGEEKQILHLHGLATLAEVWLDDRLLLRSENMFLAQTLEVDLSGSHDLYICFRALDPVLKLTRKRARWRPVMIAPGTLRYVRTTALGHMPGWCPPIDVVGPWRGIERHLQSGAFASHAAKVHAILAPDNQTGELRVSIELSTPGAGELQALLECGRHSARMRKVGDLAYEAFLEMDAVQPWWPHTHGEPSLYPVRIRVRAAGGEWLVDLGRVGFRRIEIDRGSDGRGFTLHVNGTRIFCRGACWTPTDIVALPEHREAYAEQLELVRAANMNMLRVGGTMVYEGNAFYELCDELGLLVWQDFMFANFDYPVADPAFEASVRAECAQFLDRTQISPCIAVLCGGSEVAQQAAMMGLPRETWTGPLFDDWLPAAALEYRPDVPYIPCSTWGGELPFVANAGASHYYGVGAYMRPMDDARRAEVRFASECLGLANRPDDRPLSAGPGALLQNASSWQQRARGMHIPSWDLAFFEDVRDYYLAEFYSVDPVRLRIQDPDRYAELSRAVNAEMIEAVYAEWRRKRSPTAGGLIWFLKDVAPGTGFGLIDSLGEPKSVWYAARRAFRPLQVALTDEGVNGLAVHVVNDCGTTKPVLLSLACLRGISPVVSAQRRLDVPPHTALEIWAGELLGAFFDTTYAYRFGPPGHDVTLASLRELDADGSAGGWLADAFHFPQGRPLQGTDPQLSAVPERLGDDWYLRLRAEHLALSVHIDDKFFRAEDNWFHLPPRTERSIRLLPGAGALGSPNGEVRALNAVNALRYRDGA